MQIRNQLTLKFLLIVAGILFVAFYFIHFQFKNNLRNEFFDNLRSKAVMTAEMMVGKVNEPAPSGHEPASDLGRVLYTENISVYTEDGTRVYSFNPMPEDVAPDELMRIKSANECRFTIGKFDALGILYTNRTGNKYIIVAEAVFNPTHLDNLTNILILVFILSIAIMAAAGWFFAGQALGPVSLVMNQVDAILPTDMSHRLDTPNREDEISRLVITFNQLLDRIQSAFNTQKMFLSNISHELKNPLNLIISQIEIELEKKRSDTDYRETLQSVLEDARTLNEVTNKLMQLARINSNGTPVQMQPTRIDELIWQAKSSLLKMHPGYQIIYEVQNLPDCEEKLLIKADEQLLKTALMNLIDNGCKFSADHSVKVSLSFDGLDHPRITIQDKGPGIRAGELNQVFEPFFRSTATQLVKGSGIGLALVKSIVKLHNMKMEVESEEGNGATFILEFSGN